MHGQNRCAQYVDRVDLLVVDLRHRPCDSFAFYDRTQLVALTFGELLRVIKQRMPEVIGQYYGVSHHRTSQTASSGLITSCLTTAGSIAGRKRLIQ